jgi:hypothetical protein
LSANIWHDHRPISAHHLCQPTLPVAAVVGHMAQYPPAMPRPEPSLHTSPKLARAGPIVRFRHINILL